MKRLPIAAVALCAATLIAAAQSTPETAPSSNTTRTVHISFVPPPIEGTISLGVYDLSGKLVRVLHRESETDDFTIGHDALITEWDGKNDAGEDLPAGKYHARGFSVGALSVEGVAYFFNDWVTDENSPHIKRVENLARTPNNQLILVVTLAGGENQMMACDGSTGLLKKDSPKESNGVDYYDFVSPEHLGVRIEAGKLLVLMPQGWRTVTSPNLVQPHEAALGKNGNVWVLDQIESDSSKIELKEFSPQGGFLRHMDFAPGDLPPKIIRAATNDDSIYLLEEDPVMQRIRGLTLIATKTDSAKQEAVSDWKVDFEKKIVAHKDFSLENGKPIASGGKNAPEKIAQKLQPNPLKRDKPGSVEIAVGFDAEGSYLKTSDGLPLRAISETPNLSRALLTAHGEKAIDVFQDDGAVVEQFRISGADQMMAFDCGEFELK